jgi:hypothetical protein
MRLLLPQASTALSREIGIVPPSKVRSFDLLPHRIALCWYGVLFLIHEMLEVVDGDSVALELELRGEVDTAQFFSRVPTIELLHVWPGAKFKRH